jgi:hypothetical protein
MRRVSSRALTLVTLATLVACKGEDEKKTPPAATEAPAPPADATVDPAPAVQTPTDANALGLSPVIESENPVVLQFLLRDSEALLKRMQGIDALAPYKQYLDARGLQALLALSAEEYGDAIRGLSVSDPVGCAALAKEPYEENFGCAFTFAGGAKGLVEKMGPRAKADADGHAGKIEAEGGVLFVDALEGERVAVTAGADTFKALGAHLDKQVLGRADKVTVGAEFVAMGEEAAGLMAKAEGMNPPLPEPKPTGEVLIDGLQRIIYRVQKWQRDNPAAGMEGLQQYVIGFDVNAGLPQLDFAMHVKPDSELGKAYQAAAYRTLEGKELAVIPPGTLGFMIAGMDASKWGEEAFRNGQSEVMARIWGEETGIGAEAVLSGLEGFLKSRRDHFGALVGISVDARTDSRVGITLIHQAKGDSQREVYATWAASLKPADFFGKKMGASLTFEFAKDATKVGDTPVDRLTVKPAGTLAKQLATESDPVAKALADGMIVDRVEVGGYVLTMFDLDPRTESQSRWVEWLSKPAGERKTDHLGALTKAPGNTGFIAGVDVSAIAKLAGGAFAVMEGGLDDVRLYGASLEPANFVGRFEMSAPLLKAIGVLMASEGAAARQPMPAGAGPGQQAP